MSALPAEPVWPTGPDLRALAERAEVATGLRAEIIDGEIMLSPRPRGKHFGVLRRLRNQLEAQLPPHLASGEVISLAMPAGADDYATPDLLVLDAAFMDDDRWLADPATCELAVEVVSTSNPRKDTVLMVDWYARAALPAYLLIDPCDGTWALRTRPRDGVWQSVDRGRFGETVDVSRLGVKLTTADLRLYGDARD
jgi:Uma2 family endonuclease